MTPKEKAGWLNEKFYFSLPNNGSFTGPCNINQRWEEAKMCAMMCVNELEKQEATLLGYDNNHYTSQYWQEVKQEIEKL